jgi:hypothetical protein
VSVLLLVSVFPFQLRLLAMGGARFHLFAARYGREKEEEEGWAGLTFTAVQCRRKDLSGKVANGNICSK